MTPATIQPAGRAGSLVQFDRHLVYLAFSLVLTVPLLWLFYRPGGAALDVTGHQIGRDFINVWAGPQLAFSGRLDTLFDLQAYHNAISALFGQPLPFHNWGYPLFTLPLFWPLAQLPYFAALAVWTIGLFACFAAVTLSEVERSQRTLALFLLLAAPASLINIAGGQNGFLSAALFLGGILWIDTRPIAAGVLFGLLTFKPHLGIVLPFALVALGAWRVIASAAMVTMALVASSVVLFGIEPWQQYLGVTSGYQILLLERFIGFYTLMMTSVLTAARTFGVSYSIALALQIAVAMPVLAAACWAVRRTADPCRRAFVLAAAAPLLTPYAFNYDLTAVSAVLVWILCGRLPLRSNWKGLYLLAWIAPAGLMYLNREGLGVTPLVLVLFFVLSLRDATTEPSPRPVGPTGPFTSAPVT